MKVKIGLCQMNVVDDKLENLQNARNQIVKAVSLGSKIVCLPEIFNGLYNNNSFVKNAEVQGGKTYDFLKNIANEFSIYLIGGSISERDGDKLYNTCYVFNPQGELVGKHRKVHLFDIEVAGKIKFKESDTFSAGNTLTVVDTEFGKLGVAICFDIRFAEWFRLLTNEGVRLVFVPGAFNMTTGPAHWELAFRSRAVDNQIFMAGCAPARNNEGSYVSFGHSVITNPWGEVLGSLAENEEVLVHEIDIADVEKVRNQLPIIKNMRSDLYEINYLG